MCAYSASIRNSKTIPLARVVPVTSAISLLCLILLHIVSPEIEPSWRMVSEYALGRYKWLLSIFFVFWGLSSILLASSLWHQVNSKASKIGVIFLFISGIGAALAAVFDVSQPIGHGFAGLLGIPTVPIASLLIAYHLRKNQRWAAFTKPITVLAHGTWISLVLMVVTMVVMMTGFQDAGIEMGPDSPLPSHVPDGVIAVVGYVNRSLILVDMLWLIVVASAIHRISNSHPSML